MDQIRTKLEQCRNADLMACDPDGLTDLCNVHIDTSCPVRDRMADFVRQVRNPYLFKVDGLIVKAVFRPDTDRSLTDAIPYW